MQKLIFFFDDSGILHETNGVGKFIYAGYVFKSQAEVDHAKRKYKSVVKKIQEKLCTTNEIKASSLSGDHKRALYNVLRNTESLGLIVNIPRLYSYILATPQSICRYKDYALKRLVKYKIESLVSQNVIDINEDIAIKIFIDEQLTATDGIYGLEVSIKEELQHGIKNYDYNCFHAPIFNSNVDVKVQYCVSSNNYMIQASDILANRIYASFKYNRPNLRELPNHTMLTLP